jgi:hypothetical protein
MRLADARLASDHDQGAAAPQRFLQTPQQGFPLRIATDQRDAVGPQPFWFRNRRGQTQPGQIGPQEPGASLEELLAAIDASFRHTEELAKALTPAEFAAFRGVGRKNLPTTVIGLIVHIAEHTQRHVGQAIAAAKLARAA